METISKTIVLCLSLITFGAINTNVRGNKFRAREKPILILKGLDSLKADSLIKVYESWKTSSGSDRASFEKTFFNIFPNSFNEFHSIYGVDNLPGGEMFFRPLSTCCDEHVTLFHNLKSIDSLSYFKKYIDISIGGRWDADHVGAFQEGLHEKIQNNTEQFVILLKKYKKRDVAAFWRFCFDGAHPESKTNRDLFKQIYDKVKKSDLQMAALMKAEFEELVKSSDCHGH